MKTETEYAEDLVDERAPDSEDRLEGVEQRHDEEFAKAHDTKEPDGRPIWWATWRSVLNAAGPTTITDIADGLDVFGKYHIEKISDYSGQKSKSRPTLSTWLNIYQGRIGFETYAIYMEAQDRWLSVSGPHYLDLKNSPDPIPISEALKDRGRIDLVYRVSEKKTLNYSAGYKDGYELGMSHTWIRARDTARKEVWKDAFEQGKQQAELNKKPAYSSRFTRIMAASSFVVGIAVSVLIQVYFHTL